jgi:hypothetical protein
MLDAEVDESEDGGAEYHQRGVAKAGTDAEMDDGGAEKRYREVGGDHRCVVEIGAEAEPKRGEHDGGGGEDFGG